MEVGVTNAHVTCPICDCNYVHIEAVQVNAMGQITTVSAAGTAVAKGHPSGRGSRVTVGFWCECGHSWEESLQFHEGNTTRDILPTPAGLRSSLPRD